MKNINFKILILIIIGFYINPLFAQDTIKLTESMAIAKGSTYSLKAGSVIIISPNVRVIIEGSMDLNGTKDQPIQIISENKKDAGEGFIIKGNNYLATINLSYVNFIGLIQPIRFDPYWSRKNVSIDNIKISNSNFYEPIIYVSTPIIDLNKNISKMTISNSYFYNNNAGIIIESAGNLKNEININNLGFYENNIKGIDSTLGMLHIELAKPFYNKNLIINNLAFNRNSSTNGSIGMSVTGNQDTISIDKIYSYHANRPIYDNQNDLRLPFIKTTISDLTNWPNETNWIKNIKHLEDTIDFYAIKPLNITQLLDSNGNTIPFTLNQNGEKTQLYYNQNFSYNVIPKKAVVDNKYTVNIPAPEYLKDSTRIKFLIKQQEGLWIQSKDFYFPFVKFIPTFEVLMWGGLSTIFCDVKTKWGVPGSIDWSGGFGLQYNYSKKISFNTSFYMFSLSAGNPSAAFYNARTATILYNDINKGLVYQKSSFENNFITDMKSLDFNMLWNLKPLNNYESVKSDKVTFTPVLGFGVTVFKFDPYKNLFYTMNTDSVIKVSLRELGTEGQNFNGQGQYVQYAAGLNVLAQLNVSYKKFHFKSDLKFVYTFTDYLDDYSNGKLYGGDYNKWVETNNGRLDDQINVFNTNRELKSYFPEYNVISKRTNDIIPDTYLQLHFGIGYDIGTLKNSTQK
jgi:hypothetical protein